MKHTSQEQKAIEAARAAEDLPDAEYVAIRKTPSQQRTIAQRRALLASDLKRAGETFESRERSNDLYHHYLKTGDTAEARWHAPSPLLTPTAAIRRELVEAWKELAEFDAMPFAPHVGREPKRWLKTERFHRLMEIQREIERNGGKVRYVQRTPRQESIYARIIASDQRRNNHEPQQLPLEV